MPRTAKHSRRRTCTSCSIIALATVMTIGATPASAQSLLGTGTYVTNPNATGITTAPNLTTINLNGGQTVIDWTPTDNATGTGTNINFQNSGTTALFTGTSDFAVLNRVLPTDISRAIVMNGTVNSRVSGSQRGSVYFYSPGGFVFGGTSVFSVGSLVVTALPITVSGGNFIASAGTDNTVVFGQALNPNATIVSGGSIHANIPAFGVGGSGDSYVAMIAPHVVHTGSINVNGSAALVAAEAATISFSTDGLFDIQVTTGTTSSSGLDVSGDIGGPTPVDSTDKQGVYLVAVPKNQLLTMVISNGADLGFTLANDASIDANGVVVLSGGHNIVDGQIAGNSAAPGTGTAGFDFTGAHATNNVVAEATGNVAIYSVSPNLPTTFDNNLTVHSDGNIAVSSSGSNALVSVAGNLSLSTDRAGTATPSVTAGNISLAALNTGTISVGGSINLSADAVGGDVSSGTAGSGTGGAISITATDNSSLTLDSLTTSATGMGGNALAGGVNGGAGTGGDITLTANNGSSINVSSPLTFDVQGSGGSGGGSGSGGSGTGGDARIEVGDNASLTFTGDVILDADGLGGGSGSGSGGTGTGGTATIGSVLNSSSGGLMTFNGEVELSADGEGGPSNGGTGGTGQGGTAQITSNAHHFVLNDFTSIHAGGAGGSSGSSTGGIGQGGTAAINLTGSSELDATFVSMDARGEGGDGAIGGTGLGGNGNIISESDGTIADAVINAIGTGGDGFDGNGGLGDAGTINVGANGGDLTILSLQVDAWAQGGEAFDLGTTSGAGLGGDIFVQALANGSLSLGSLDANADGSGGSTGVQAAGGLGSGGNITVEAFGANAALSVTGNTSLTANGYGGEGLGDCFLCGGAGGDGSGGHVFVRANGATATVNLVNVDAYARGYGGLGLDFDGGNGTGGSVQIYATSGGTLDVDGNVLASADGTGGDENGSGGDFDVAAGNGTGGFVELFTFGSGSPDIDILGSVDLHADGYGGDNFGGGAGSLAGSGTGGTAWLDAQSGAIDITGNASVTAAGHGGFAQSGIGGDGTGKNAEIDGIGGSVTIGGTALVDVSGEGGDGQIAGGDGVGGGELFDDGTGVDGAHIFAQNGSINITGTATLSATGEGGQGLDGSFEASGGAGGNAAGGWTTVTAANSNLGPSSIGLSNLFISASVIGGDGGQGGSGNQGGDGGIGGNALGGTASVHANAGNGHVTVTTVNASASAIGGQGGDGGNGDGLGGGDGGDGGNARGGGTSIGTASGNNQAAGANLGTATYGTIFADSSATGGNGGNGNFGSSSGNGGDGGDAFGGSASILVRGSTVTLTDAFLSANADGGDAGFGYQPEAGTPGTTGVGGDASIGGDVSGGVNSDTGIGVLVTNRFEIPGQRGTLNAGSIHGTAIASSGIGIPNGNSTTLGGSHVTFVNSDATIGSLDFEVGFGGLNTSSTGHDSISLVNSTVGVAGEFSFVTPGNLSFYIDNGSLTAGTMALSAGNFITDPDHGAPLNRGTAFANSATIATLQDFIANANFDVNSNLTIAAPGLIEAHNFIIDGNLQLSAASGGISVDNLSTVGSVSLLANGSIQTAAIGAGTSVFGRANGAFTSANIGAGTFIDIRSGGAMTLGNLSAGDYIDLRSNGPILFQNAISGETINLQTLGSLTTGNLTAGDSILGQAIGAISVGTLSAGLVDPSAAPGARYRTSLASDTGITTAAVTAAGDIGFGTPGNLVTGTLNSGGGLMALVGGNINTLDVTANGYVYLANYSMSALGGAFETFDRTPILASAATPTGGSITLGNVNTGKFTAAAGTSLTTGIINSGGSIGLGAGAAITTGNLFAGDFVLANGGSITTQNIVANSVDMTSTGGHIQTNNVTSLQSIGLNSGGNVTTANLTAGDSVEIDAVGSVATGNISAGLVNPSSSPDADYFAVIRAGGAIATGNINAAQNIGLATPGTITTADINAGGIFMALGHGNMLFGDATASEVFLADFATLVFGGGGGGLANCVGTCGTLGADGVVTAPPSGSFYSYLTTEGGVDGAGQLPGAGTAEGATNGSLYTTAFSAAAGDDLNFWFNYVTSDGSGFADYAWATLLTASLDPVATLFTARTQPSGTIVPGQGLPGVEATLNPASVPIIDGAPVWSPLGTSSGTCYDVGCGFTGWINSTYDIPTAGNYVLRFGVSNWTDTAYQSGMAFSGITIGGVPVTAAAARTGGSITIGNVDTGKFTAAAGTSLTTGVIDSTGSIDMDAGGAITTANLFAGSFLHANGGSIATQNMDANSVDMTSTAGNITTGNVDALGTVALDAFSNMTTGAITAGEIDARAGGTATINGVWAAPLVTLTSNDINIGATGGIAAGAGGEVNLFSSNAQRVLIGDGLTLTGYALSNAEFSRISGGDITITAGGLPGAAADTLIGNLTITAGPTGNIRSANGGIAIVGLDEAGVERDGTMRVVGAVTGSGFTNTNYLAFATQTFELNTATGSVSLTSSGTTLGGELDLFADRIHVASATILNQLAANPTYSGYQQDLNRTATVQRPEGVLRASTLWIESDNLHDVLIQNTGTTATPAGFLVNEVFINDDSEVAGPPGSINLIVNGQVVTEGGTLTGIAARDALTEEADLSPFTANSTINGCPLSGACVIVPELPGLIDRVDIPAFDVFGDSAFGNEQDIDDNQEGDQGANNPISPPQPLFDTRPLIPASEVNDPVSGTGNPSLLGSSDCDKDDEGQCATEKEEGQ